MHALLTCTHANQLCSAMRGIWHLPSFADLRLNSHTWLKEVILSADPQVIDALLLTIWRIWFAHNEVTHAKPLPSIEGSKRFLISYMQTLKGIHRHSTEEVIKGKQILLSGMSDVSETSQRMKSPEKKWASLSLVGLN
jgi:hypothetical protein